MRTHVIRKFLAHSGKFAVIAVLFLGGTYVFETINSVIPTRVQTVVEASGEVDIWWPTHNAVVNGLQPFKGLVKDKDISDYDMYWSVDGGQPTRMDDSNNDYPHKEIAVDLSGWTWRGAGPYKITFKATDKSGNALGEQTISIMTAAGQTEVKSSKNSIDPVSTVAPKQAAADTVEAQPVVITDSSSDASTKTAEQAQETVVTNTVSSWWPVENANVSGVQPFKAVVDGRAPDTYKMYWTVDGGERNEMRTSYADGPHKEASVDLSSWNWKGSGPYKVTFIATRISGAEIGKKTVTIFTGNAPAQPAPQPVPAPAAPVVQPVPAPEPIRTITLPVPEQPILVSEPAPGSSGNPLVGAKLYVDPNSNAKNTANQWRSSRPADAAQMDKIAGQAKVEWLGGWNSDISNDVRNAVTAAKNQGAVPVFVAYNIPNRDCGQYSAGGVNDANAYRSWIQKIADAIGSNKAAVILEPDALTLTSCLSGAQQQERNDMLKTAISQFKAKGNIAVYLDVGHAGWLSADDAAAQLKNAGVSSADGFALNTSNFFTTADNVRYGEAISAKIGGKHFVIDTARNGNGPTTDRQWCNPWGRALGNKPTTSTGHSLIDAYLWIKTPGESDGNCNGGPNAGAWWPEYALGLAKNAGW